MAIVEHVPTIRRGLGTVVATASALWVGAYWLNERAWDWLLHGAWGMDPGANLTQSVHFFFYDVIKIALLLTGIIFVITVARSFMSVERTRRLLGGKREGVGNAMAAGLGTITPFCSCSAVPAFIGFVAAGVPTGVTLSFLIASPLVSEIAAGMLWAIFGWEIALLYVVAGWSIAVIAGWVLGRLGAERWVESFVFQTTLHGQALDPSVGLSLQQRVQMGVEEVGSILRKIWPYLLVGIGIGAVIHGWVPQDFFASVASADNLLAVPAAVALGVPLYSNAAGIMPLVEALFAKGVPMGTLLAFMMSVVALSLPEMVLLKRVLKLPLIGLFIAVVAAGIVAVGYLFNLILT